MNYYNNNYLMHYGIKGMKWGVRRYRNRDGSLTAEGQKHYDDYKTSQSLRKKLNDEGNRLINSNKRLAKDYGGKYENVDDDADFEYTARNYGMNTDKFWDSKVSYSKFHNENRKSIETGRKLAEKYGLK